MGSHVCSKCQRSGHNARTCYNKREVVDKLKEFLGKINNEAHNENKKILVLEMMSFLQRNIRFVHDHEHFSNVVRKKLEEFAIVNNWRLEEHYKKIFKKSMPSNEIILKNRQL